MLLKLHCHCFLILILTLITFAQIILKMKNLVEELKWRGLYHDSMPGTEEQLLKEVTTAYIGFDPTADSLHIGSMVQIILLVHLKELVIKRLLWLVVQPE